MPVAVFECGAQLVPRKRQVTDGYVGERYPGPEDGDTTLSHAEVAGIRAAISSKECA